MFEKKDLTLVSHFRAVQYLIGEMAIKWMIETIKDIFSSTIKNQGQGTFKKVK